MGMQDFRQIGANARLLTLASFASIAATFIPTNTLAIRTSQYAAGTSKGGAIYVADVDQTTGFGASTWRTQSADGKWWVLDAAQEPTFAMFGALGNRTSDDTAALQAALYFSSGVISITSMTAVGAVVTCTVASTAGLFSQQRIDIIGAEQYEYLHEHTISITSATTFTFTASLAPAVSPATGTIIATTRSSPIRSGSGQFKATTDLFVPVGCHASQLRGAGQDGAQITFSGTSILNGLCATAQPVMNFTLSGVTGTFTVGETVTQTNGATGKVTAWTSGTGNLRVANVPFDNTFKRGVTITGGSSGATGTLGTVDISSPYKQGPCLTDLRIAGDTAAYPKRLLTLYGLSLAKIRNVKVRDADGSGIGITYCLETSLDQVAVFSCGSATASPIEIDYCTTVRIDHPYISGKNSGTVAGLRIDRTGQVTITGGAIETCGIPIQIASKAEGTLGVSQVTVNTIDVENPAAPTVSGTVTITIASPGVVTWTAHGLQVGSPVTFATTGALPTGLVAGTTYYVSSVPSANTFQVTGSLSGAAINTSGSQSGVHTASFNPSCYIEAGYGWTGSSGLAVLDLHLVNCKGAVSGAAAIPFAARLVHTTGFTVIGGVFAQPGTPVATWGFMGSGNFGAVLYTARAMYGNAYPYVVVANVQQLDATPKLPWEMETPSQWMQRTDISTAVTTIDCHHHATQGGINGHNLLNSPTPHTVTSMNAARQGNVVIFVANNGNTTFQHGTGTNGFFNKTGADFTAESGKSYSYIYSFPNRWSQI